ncbi:MAG: pyruvate ferredoxin oxidoreductase [Eubacterium sp.]|nr:pyruvate ferredoxin oxidoreductase [Eubacterium sp.]
MGTKAFLSANEAAAHGVRLAKPDVVSAYPITPQTTLVEKIADFIADGELGSKYMMVESEHSAMASALGASMMGARVFTASSSQGLLYMCEMLNYVSGARHPVVMADANRSTATPWNIFGDHRDAMSMRDSGFIQLYVESGQEALDTMIQAYKIAEDPEVMIPVMVNIDGFTLTHTYDLVDIPTQEEVDAFLPPFNTTLKHSLENPMVTCATIGPLFHTEGRIQQQAAFEVAKKKINEVAADFAKAFGRDYCGLVEEYKCEDAEVVLVATGSCAGTARVVVDQRRAAGEKVGMIKLRSFRPFPKEYFESLGDRFKAVGVTDKDYSFGFLGTVYSEVRASMYDSNAKMANFICGLGGRDVSKAHINEMFDVLKNLADGKQEEEVQWIGRRW